MARRPQCDQPLDRQEAQSDQGKDRKQQLQMGNGAHRLPPSRRKPLKTTSSEAPMSAAMAAQREAWPAKVRTTKTTLTAREKVMFCRITRSVWREWRISQG